LHFFNPPRWMYLLEVIPGADTDPAVVEAAADFCDRALGKGIVQCRDTPNFIGNRIGIVEMLLTLRAAAEENLTVEEVDFLNGPLVGRPKTGTYRLGDMVGIDVLAHVVENLKNGLHGDPTSKNYDPLHSLMETPPVVENLIKTKRLGDKTGSGFYKKSKDDDGKRVILSLDLKTYEYRPRQEPEWPDLQAKAKLMPLAGRLETLFSDQGSAGAFARKLWFPLFNYCSFAVGRICATPAEIDHAMCWGYGWQKGPFELLDLVGPAKVVEHLQAEGIEPAEFLLQLLEKEGKAASIYSRKSGPPTLWTPQGKREPIPRPRGVLRLDELNAPPLKANSSAALLHLGDGIACLEFRSKANILDAGVVSLMSEAPEWLLSEGYRALVIGNSGEHFCRGANLMHIAGLIAQKKFDGIELAIRELQDAVMNLRHGAIPVVAAPIGQTLGGGTEVCLHCDRIQAGADLFLGLVEAGVGVLPAGGGLKEIARRASEWAAMVPSTEPYEFVRRGFNAVATAQVSSSAEEARENGFLTPQDTVTFNRARLLADAKKRALGLANGQYVPPSRDQSIRVIGEAGGANLELGIELFGWGGYASEYDKFIAKKVVHVLSGGMSLRKDLIAQELLDLEREAFTSLCGEEKTFARIQHMLKTKRPLRN
ncbi:MAG: 3-hydroxyacyl-CoA dehydrogenase family protein, partial [Polyangiaceae bacterium]|nr:3-hydroxyacyl-CoA dehydrogenase family protein [Polyangiaceae bacterium]